jgi:hypothetical protein
MFSEVYWHHAVRSATAMFQRAFYLLHHRLDLDSLFRRSEDELIRTLIQAAGEGPAHDLLDGLFGPRPVRLGALWHRASGGLGWLRTAVRDLRAGRWPAWRQAPSVLMGGVLLALLVVLPLVAASGYATFAEWGGDMLAELHESLANGALGLVLLHLAMVAAIGLMRRQNPALPMLTGRVPGRGPDLVPRQRWVIAALVLVGAVAFGAWQWSVVQAAGGGDRPAAGELRGKLADDD